MRVFEIQGHRGARGRKPDNTLPSFEIALDVGVASIETDLHRSRDGQVVVCHEPRMPDGKPVAAQTLAELRSYSLSHNSDPQGFPDQDNRVTPVAAWFAQEHGFDPFALLQLTDLFAFVQAYAGEPGRRAGKSGQQRKQAQAMIFDLEVKRIPFYPEAIGDDYHGQGPAQLEREMMGAIRSAGLVDRCRVRSFDHRCVRAFLELEPRLTRAVLISNTAVADPGAMAGAAGATIICPNYFFLDRQLVETCHHAGLKVLPWTVNDPNHWRKLLDWGVDGITTDYPDRLAAFALESGYVAAPCQ